MVNVLIDLGSYEIQIGIAGNDEPSIIIPSIYADSTEGLYSNLIFPELNVIAKERFYGIGAIKFRDVLKINYILQKKDFNSLCSLLEGIFQEYEWLPQELSLIIIDNPRMTAQFKIDLQKYLFSILKISQIAYVPSGQSILSALGLESGIIIDIGHFTTTIEGIFKGFPNPESMLEFPIGGYHITSRLVDLIFSRIQFETITPLFWIAEDIKRTNSFTIMDPIKETNAIRQGKTDYNMNIDIPDGRTFTINSERFNCVEPIFEPELVHIRSENLIQYLERSIRAWERQQIPELVQHIILAGNGAKIPKLDEKIEKMIKERFPKTLNFKIITPPSFKKIFWIGASILYAKNKGNLEWIENSQKDKDVVP